MEGNEWAARVERRYTIQRAIRWLSRTAQVGPTILFECPAKIPRSSLRSFSLWARHSAETSAELNVRSGAAEFFPVASRQVRRVRKRRREGNARGLCLITASCPKTPLVAQKLRSHGRGFLKP